VKSDGNVQVELVICGDNDRAGNVDVAQQYSSVRRTTKYCLFLTQKLVTESPYRDIVKFKMFLLPYY
jgi:hypothetical protein